tara:strand:+ start:229 stop:432 length:204 start_codon:yes stop_codon:yes gene_type:complete
MDYLNLMTEWLASYSSILIGIGGLSILILIFSIIGLGWFISQIPEDILFMKKGKLITGINIHLRQGW